MGQDIRRDTRQDIRKIEESDIKNYRQQLVCEEKSKNTIEKYIRDIHVFGHWMEAEGIGDMTKEAVLRFKQYLKETKKPSGANSMIVALNGFFDYMGWKDCRVKTMKIQSNYICRENKELTRAEYKQLLDTARRDGNERLALLMETIASTGIRISELKFITVEALRHGKACVDSKGKYREVFLVKELCRHLRKYCKKHGIKSGIIFCTKTGRPLNRSNIWKEMKEMAKKAGVKESKVFPHNLRHLFARVFYQMHKNIGYLADILGHSSINTTRIYTATTEDHHLQMLEVLRLVS